MKFSVARELYSNIFKQRGKIVVIRFKRKLFFLRVNTRVRMFPKHPTWRDERGDIGLMEGKWMKSSLSVILKIYSWPRFNSLPVPSIVIFSHRRTALNHPQRGCERNCISIIVRLLSFHFSFHRSAPFLLLYDPLLYQTSSYITFNESLWAFYKV